MRHTRRGFITASTVSLGGLAIAETTPTPAPRPEDTITRAEAQQARIRREAEQWGRYGPALAGRFGDGVLEVLTTTTIESQAKRLRERDVPHRDLDGVRELLWDRLGAEYEVALLERTPETLKYKVTRCPWATEYRKQNAAAFGFALVCASDEGFCKGLNPAIRFRRTKTLMQGDDCCDHAYELERAAGDPESKGPGRS